MHNVLQSAPVCLSPLTSSGHLERAYCKHESGCPGGAFLHCALPLPYIVCEDTVLLGSFASVMHMRLGADTGLLRLMYRTS